MGTAYEIARSLKNALPWGEWSKGAVTKRLLATGYIDGAIDNVDYVRGSFEQHRSVTGTTRGRVLEIGPGGNVGVAALYVHHGAEEAVCIDAMPWDRGRDGAGKEPLYRDIGVTEDLERVRFVAPVTIEEFDAPDESFDIVFSHATLEHVGDPDRAVANIARLMRPGGVTSHQIDLRDHADFDRPLEFLRHRDLTWRLLSAGMLSPTNRLRASEWSALFARHGLEPTITVTEVARVDGRERDFAPRFRRMDTDELKVVGIHLWAAKPSGRPATGDANRVP